MPNYLKIPCTNCAGHIEFPEEIQGQQTTCPHCGKTITLCLLPVPPNEIQIRDPEPVYNPADHFGLLPKLTDESLTAVQVRSSKGTNYYTVSLIDYTCTCPSFTEDHAKAPPRNYGRMCKHICGLLNQRKFLPLLDPICLAMVTEGFGVCPGRMDRDMNGHPIYITGTNSSGWLNVFALKRVNGKKYYQFGYNVNENRWAYGNRPKIDEQLLAIAANEKTTPKSQGGRIVSTILSIIGTTLTFIVCAFIKVFFALILAFLKPEKRRRRH